jgi:hypothetical protein
LSNNNEITNKKIKRKVINPMQQQQQPQQPSFLAQALSNCAPGQVSLGNGLCSAALPRQDGLSAQEEVEYLLSLSPFGPNSSAPNPARFAYEQSDTHLMRPYCGSQPHILYSTLYAQTYSLPNPYGYTSVGNNAQCFLIGRNLSTGLNSNVFGFGGVVSEQQQQQQQGGANNNNNRRAGGRRGNAVPRNNFGNNNNNNNDNDNNSVASEYGSEYSVPAYEPSVASQPMNNNNNNNSNRNNNYYNNNNRRNPYRARYYD